MCDNIDFYLASSSPRRKDLLQQIGTRFDIIKPEIDETPNINELPKDYVTRIAKLKALTGWQMLKEKYLTKKPVLAADTTVIFKNTILGKPKDKSHAMAMLEMLSNNSHQVMTSVAIIFGEKYHQSLCSSIVEFCAIDPQLAEKYWYTGEAKDKAGAYAIQGLGAIFVKKITGSYSAIVGLPLWETKELFDQFKIKYWKE